MAYLITMNGRYFGRFNQRLGWTASEDDALRFFDRESAQMVIDLRAFAGAKVSEMGDSAQLYCTPK